MPRTVTGRACVAILARPGVWARAGMGGVPAGLNLPEALSSLPAHADPETARIYLIEGESAFLDGVWRRADEKGKPENGQ
jgi:hypothetical protein